MFLDPGDTCAYIPRSQPPREFSGRVTAVSMVDVWMEAPRMLRRVGLVIVLCLAGSSALFAQATATISGRAVDEAAAVLPGVTITVTNTATGAVRTTVTNEEGLYSVPALIPGIYNVRAELAGFAP